MLLVNIIFILLVLGFVGAGMKDGLVQTIGRMVGAVIGFVVARAWYTGFATILGIFMPDGIAKLVAFGIIFIAITRLVGLAFKLVDGLFKIISFIPFLKSINSLLGAIAGFAEGIIIIGGLIFLVKMYLLEPHLVAWINESIVAQWIASAFKLLLGVLL